MSNCLSRLVPRALGGRRLYLRHRGKPAVSAELVRTPQGWQPGQILGKGNRAIDRTVEVQIAFELKELAASVPCMDDGTLDNLHIGIFAELRRDILTRFDPDVVERMAQPLRQIQGRSRSSRNGAFAIFSIENGGFVQFLSSVDGASYACEILSHQFQPHVAEFLESRAVDTIVRAGFEWPQLGSTQNFYRQFAVSGPGDCRVLAEVTLALLARIFRHRPSEPVHVECHVPS